MCPGVSPLQSIMHTMTPHTSMNDTERARIYRKLHVKEMLKMTSNTKIQTKITSSHVGLTRSEKSAQRWMLVKHDDEDTSGRMETGTLLQKWVWDHLLSRNSVLLLSLQPSEKLHGFVSTHIGEGVHSCYYLWCFGWAGHPERSSAMQRTGDCGVWSRSTHPNREKEEP